MLRRRPKEARRFGEIFEDYERQLKEAGSLLVVGDGTTREQLEANAHSVLERAAKVLRDEEESLLAVEEEIYRNIEASEEPLSVQSDRLGGGAEHAPRDHLRPRRSRRSR